MAAAAEVQALLRFLTKDARIPLAEAMPKINALRKQQLNTPENIANANEADLRSIFADEKVLKQVANAAKRVSNPKKRAASAQSSSPSSKRARSELGPADDEALLVPPQTNIPLEKLEHVIIETNRAPLFLAFTIAVLAYTHPEQPLSSRWSLAQGVVSAGAQSKAKYLGLTSGPTAEEDGWAQGQPKVMIMGREIAVMRRHVPVDVDGEATTPGDAFWALDLEALRKSNGPLIAGKDVKRSSGPPIHKAAAPRNYLLKSMMIIDPDPALSGETTYGNGATAKKKNTQEVVKKKEDAAAMMLKAIDAVCKSWASVLTAEQLDQRAQTWYTRVRPDVEQGQAGWGHRGQVRIADILKLRKE
ncbi:hypothetical protein G647_02306 [Cladophialophora carrionii CBS 160.54]|uniref:Impact N-terminal domain-containing protein n=1 Tax=Cladophialophora carrionii CBS 160.54 TaxID=1279043 RepID=V9DGS9_9EURO|nr:uncharacterized protein G647_02306 [Cladophialophora carrionii CBS 160.54]ETI25533.1 hypothetical protein G647_02306 [Cladophialophora carrionii CBS 160.54]